MNGFQRVAAYLRVSSQKQADERTILSQRQDIIMCIGSDQLHLDEAFEFADDGYTGSDLVRPALEKLRDRVAASLIDRLYIHSPDRLARKFAHQAILLEEFQRHNCEVVFLNQEGLPQSPETNLLLTMVRHATEGRIWRGEKRQKGRSEVIRRCRGKARLPSRHPLMSKLSLPFLRGQ